MEPRWPCVCGLWLLAGYNQSLVPCLVPRPRFSSRPKRFGSRGLCENASDTSTKRIDREGLENAVQGLGKLVPRQRPMSAAFDHNPIRLETRSQTA